jgi:eukaryotic-like serine/threonine-protein kinase
MATRQQPGAGSAQTLKLPERYRALRHLANGGMASVWCAEDLMLQRTVAVKVLAERFAHDDMAVRRFKREARAAARVANHAHVVTIFDVGDLEPEVRGGGPGRAFIVMQYLAGGTVADALRVGAVRRQEAVRWIREAASALDHAHARGIVHRDIKPANFLLNRSRVLHVADFGIARLLSEDTITSAGELFGTAAYLSPEQALGREATGASDRYALAVAAFELLAGERPFGAQHFAAQARQHIEDPPPNASDRDRTLPAPVDDVLIRGMAKQAEDRFETAGGFVDALETALSGGIPVVARRPPGPPRERGARRFVGVAAASRLRADPADAPPTAAIWTPADSLQRVSGGHRRAGRAVALIALLAAIVGVGAVALAGLGGSGPRTRTAARTHTTTRAAHVHHHVTKPQAVAQTPTTASAAPSTPTTSATPTAPATPAAAPSAAQLQLTGHDQLNDGNYTAAIATLRKAVSAAAPGSLTYDYGLYDLGKALLLSGDAAGAVPILEQRAKIPNQTPVVLETLNQALRADGQPAVPIPGQSDQPGGQAPSGPAGKGAGSGGAGLGQPGHGHGRGSEHNNFVD